MEKEKYERELLEQQKRRKSLARSPILPAQIERSQVAERMEGVEQSTIASEEGEGNEGEDEGESEIEKERRSPSEAEKREIERRARERRRLKEVEEGLTQTESETAESDKESSRKRKRREGLDSPIEGGESEDNLVAVEETLETIERWFRATRIKSKGISMAVETKLLGYLRVIKNSVDKEKNGERKN
ncbi:hypothetical protein J6590_068287 [Homalodisca vitripennis]|nr:hypothetical protein J6590_068287 [Homalodisca vitripennis]